jgi:nucleotide-binding universal stress UspA family protein
MGTSGDGVIVVGVDGSDESLLAVDWAATEAASIGCPLTLCHATPYGPAVGLPEYSFDAGRAGGEEIAQRAAERVRAAVPGVQVTEAVSPGPATPLLLEQSATARLVVVGCRGVGAFRGLLLGSISQQVAAHASCPVVVVRGAPDQTALLPADAPVTVGVDWSGHEAALAFAFDFAGRHHRPVVAVHAFRLPPLGPPADASRGAPPVELAQAVTDLLEDAVAQWRDKYPDVPVRLLPLDADPAAGLIEQSAGSSLVVVGSRGHGGFSGLLLGSVSQHVLRHAGCPVAVVRG